MGTGGAIRSLIAISMVEMIERKLRARARAWARQPAELRACLPASG
jgi:hypothetical protein